MVWSGNGHGYEVQLFDAAAAGSWTSARFLAESAGGHVATIATAAEEDVVTGLVSLSTDVFAANGSGPFLGGYQPAPTADEEPAGGWAWVDGTPWAFTAWASKQPDNGGGTENYVVLFTGVGTSATIKWNDHEPTGMNSYVVEFE